MGLRLVKHFRWSIDRSATPTGMARVKPSSGVHTPKKFRLMPLHQLISREKRRSIIWRKALASLTSAPRFGSLKLNVSRSCQHPGWVKCGIGIHLLPSVARKTAISRKESLQITAESSSSQLLITWTKFTTKFLSKRSQNRLPTGIVQIGKAN